MRAPVLALAGVAILFGPCGLPELPERSTEQELGSHGIDQGLAGKAAVRTGDCMPGCGLRTCSIQRVPLELRVFEAEPRLQITLDPAHECRRPFGHLSVVWPEDPPVVAGSVWLGDKDQYALELAPGSYQSVMVDDAGCGTCAEEEDGDGGIRCRTFEISPGEIRPGDVLMNWAAE